MKSEQEWINAAKLNGTSVFCTTIQCTFLLSSHHMNHSTEINIKANAAGK